MLVVNKVTFNYAHRKKKLFEDFSLQLEPGHIYGLLGGNGAGKSTLLYLMAGLLTPRSGSLLLNGVNVRDRNPQTLREIFFVPDEYELPRVKLSDYIRTYSVFYPRFSHADLKHYLEVFGMSEDVHLGELSLGQGKKVFMSFAMATHTQVLLMDEPSNGLDIPGKEQFRQFLMAGRQADSIFLLSTHQVKDVENVLDRVLVLDDNRLLVDVDANGLKKEGKLDLEEFFNEQINLKNTTDAIR